MAKIDDLIKQIEEDYLDVLIRLDDAKRKKKELQEAPEKIPEEFKNDPEYLLGHIDHLLDIIKDLRHKLELAQSRIDYLELYGKTNTSVRDNY